MMTSSNENWWVNNGEAGDLRRHRTHYDVTVMYMYEENILWSETPVCIRND